MNKHTTGRIYDNFSHLLLFHGHREASALDYELPEESDQFRFLRATCLDNLKDSVGCHRFDFGESIGHENFYTT
jgi:hypothetical protein